MLTHLHTLELLFLQQMQTCRTPFLDGLFRTLNFFDTREFLLLLIPAIWYGFSRKTGFKFIFILMLSGWLNYFLKKLFMTPRPLHLDPSLGVIKLMGSYGFPSGAAQQSFFLGVLLINSYRTVWAWVIGLVYILLISFSRIYLGVHFPSDILGGWCVGCALLWIYLVILPYFDDRIALFSRNAKIVCCAGTFLVCYLLSPSAYMSTIIYAILGMFLGVILGQPLPIADQFYKKAMRVCVAILGVIAIQFLPINVFVVFLAGFWLSFGAYYSILLLEKRWKSIKNEG